MECILIHISDIQHKSLWHYKGEDRPEQHVLCDTMRRDRVIGLNAENDGACRTIKAVYWKTSLANFLHTGDWGATGAKVVYET